MTGVNGTANVPGVVPVWTLLTVTFVVATERMRTMKTFSQANVKNAMAKVANCAAYLVQNGARRTRCQDEKVSHGTRRNGSW